MFFFILFDHLNLYIYSPSSLTYQLAKWLLTIPSGKKERRETVLTEKKEKRSNTWFSNWTWKYYMIVSALYFLHFMCLCVYCVYIVPHVYSFYIYEYDENDRIRKCEFYPFSLVFALFAVHENLTNKKKEKVKHIGNVLLVGAWLLPNIVECKLSLSLNKNGNKNKNV